jgi:xylulokinase
VGRVGLMIGTTAVLLDVADGKAADYDRELLTMPAPDGNLVWAENGFAGRVVAHVLETLIHADDALAAHAVDDAFVNLDAALDASEPGAGGVLFLPWLAGSMSPAIDHQMRGGFLGLSLTTTRTDLVRAAVEGTAHNLAWLLRAVEQFTGHATDEIVFGGGAARSGGWAQVIADVVGRPVRPLAEPAHGVARASAELALGHAPDRLVHLDSRVHEPRAAVHERATAQQVRFEAVFEALRPIWHADPTAPSTADRNEP